MGMRAQPSRVPSAPLAVSAFVLGASLELSKGPDA